MVSPEPVMQGNAKLLVVQDVCNYRGEHLLYACSTSISPAQTTGTLYTWTRNSLKTDRSQESQQE